MSLYILRGELGITGASPPGLPEIRTAAAQAPGTAGLAQASPVPASQPWWGGMLQPVRAPLLSPGPVAGERVAVNSWDLASGLAVPREMPVVTMMVMPFGEPTI